MTNVPPPSSARFPLFNAAAARGGRRGKGARRLLPRELLPDSASVDAALGDPTAERSRAARTWAAGPAAPASADADALASPARSDAAAVARARAAVARVSAATPPEAQAALPYVLTQFESTAMQAALRDVPPGSTEEARLLVTLTGAFIGMMDGDPDAWEDTPGGAVATYLLERCGWEAICEPRLFDKLQLMMTPDLAMAFIRAEARDAAAARVAVPVAFAGIPDGAGVVEGLLTRRRTQCWDSFLQVQSTEILRDAIDANDFARVEALMTFAPQGGAAAAARILFENVGPGDPVLPALRLFCAKHGLGVPTTLQTPPEPVTIDFIDALLMQVQARGQRPADVAYFWRVFERCAPDLRERLLRTDLDTAAGGPFTSLLLGSPPEQVVQAFPVPLLGRLLQSYRDRFSCPLLGFGTDFAGVLVTSLPRADVENLVGMNNCAAVTELSELGHWALLGKIVQRVEGTVRAQVLALLRRPLPERHEDDVSTDTMDSLSGALEFEAEGSTAAPCYENGGNASDHLPVVSADLAGVKL